MDLACTYMRCNPVSVLHVHCGVTSNENLICEAGYASVG